MTTEPKTWNRSTTILVEELQKEAFENLKHFDQTQAIRKAVPQVQIGQSSGTSLSSVSKIGSEIEPLFFSKQNGPDGLVEHSDQDGHGPRFSTCAGRQLSTLSREKKNRDELLRNFMPYSSSELRLFTCNNLVGPPVVRVKVRPPSLVVDEDIDGREQQQPSAIDRNRDREEEEEEDNTVKFYATVVRSYKEDRQRARQEILNLTGSDERTRDTERRKIEQELEQLRKQEEGITDTEKQQLLEIILYRQILNYDSAGIADRIRLGAQCGVRSGAKRSESTSASASASASAFVSDPASSSSSFAIEEDEASSDTLLLKNIGKKENINMYFYVTSLVLYRMGMVNIKNEKVVEYRWKLCLDNTDPDMEDERKRPGPWSSVKLSSIYQGVRVVSLRQRSDFVYLNVVRDLPLSVPILNVPPTLQHQAHQLNDLYLQFFHFKAITEKKLRGLLKLLHKTTRARGITGEIDALSTCQLDIFNADGSVGSDNQKKVIQCYKDTIARSPWIEKLTRINKLRSENSQEPIWGGVGTSELLEEIDISGSNIALKFFGNRLNVLKHAVSDSKPKNKVDLAKPVGDSDEIKDDKDFQIIVEKDLEIVSEKDKILKLIDSWISLTERLLIWIFPSSDAKTYMLLQLENAFLREKTTKSLLVSRKWLNVLTSNAESNLKELFSRFGKELNDFDQKLKLQEHEQSDGKDYLDLYQKKAILLTRARQNIVQYNMNIDSWREERSQIFLKVIQFINSKNELNLIIKVNDIIQALADKTTSAFQQVMFEDLMKMKEDENFTNDLQENQKRCRVLIEVCQFWNDRKLGILKVSAQEEICLIFLTEANTSKVDILLTILEMNYGLLSTPKQYERLKLLSEESDFDKLFKSELKEENKWKEIQAFQLILEMIFGSPKKGNWFNFGKSMLPFFLEFYEIFLTSSFEVKMEKGGNQQWEKLLKDLETDTGDLKKWENFGFENLLEFLETQNFLFQNPTEKHKNLCERYKELFTSTACSALSSADIERKVLESDVKEFILHQKDGLRVFNITEKPLKEFKYFQVSNGDVHFLKLFLFRVVVDTVAELNLDNLDLSLLHHETLKFLKNVMEKLGEIFGTKDD